MREDLAVAAFAPTQVTHLSLNMAFAMTTGRNCRSRPNGMVVTSRFSSTK